MEQIFTNQNPYRTSTIIKSNIKLKPKYRIKQYPTDSNYYSDLYRCEKRFWIFWFTIQTFRSKDVAIKYIEKLKNNVVWENNNIKIIEEIWEDTFDNQKDCAASVFKIIYKKFGVWHNNSTYHDLESAIQCAELLLRKFTNKPHVIWTDKDGKNISS